MQETIAQQKNQLNSIMVNLIKDSETKARKYIAVDRPEEAVDMLLGVMDEMVHTINCLDTRVEAITEDFNDVFDYFGYEIYVVLGESDVLYVGSGKHGRHKHCTSGRSHVKQLNEALYTKKPLQVNVIATQLNKDVSLHLERILITYLEPKFNKNWNLVK